MKTLLASLVSVFLLNSCVFDEPFAAKAEIPINQALLGRWESIPDSADAEPERMVVLQHSENEYVVAYPLGGDAMAFRAYPVKLEGRDFVQIQLIGTVKGPVETKDRKFHLLQVKLDGDTLETRTIDPEVIGKDHKSSADLLAAFKAHKDDAGLFQKPARFHRMK
jgi:hypothetical protein